MIGRSRPRLKLKKYKRMLVNSINNSNLYLTYPSFLTMFYLRACGKYFSSTVVEGDFPNIPLLLTVK